MVLFTVIVLMSSFLATYFVSDVDSFNESPSNQRDSNSFFSFGTVIISPFDYYTYSWDTARDVFKLAARTFSDISDAEYEYEFWKRKEHDHDDDDDDILDNTNYEGVHSSKGFKSTVKVAQKSGTQRRDSSKRKSRSPPSRFERVVRGFVYRFTTGLGVVGILSFLNLLFSFGLFAPLRLFGGNWTRGQRGRAAANDTASLVIIIFVIIGIVRCAYILS